MNSQHRVESHPHRRRHVLALSIAHTLAQSFAFAEWPQSQRRFAIAFSGCSSQSQSKPQQKRIEVALAVRLALEIEIPLPIALALVIALLPGRRNDRGCRW
jgi:hypothetical protein